MNFKVGCFNERLLVVVEAPYKLPITATINQCSFHQSLNIYPNFLQHISRQLEQTYQQYSTVCAILYRIHTRMMNNFPNGIKHTITYYVYYTNMDDCRIDDVFYDELLHHLVVNMKMSSYVSQVFLQSLRNGFNKPDHRIDGLCRNYNLATHHDNLQEIRRLVLNLSPEQKRKIETIVTRNSTFNAILPNMLLLNVTNCIQQESLSIKHSSENGGSTSRLSIPKDSDNEEEDNNDELEDESMTTVTDTDTNVGTFRSYIPDMEIQQHCYYCSYGNVVIVEANIQQNVFQNLITKNIIAAFLVNKVYVDQLHIFLYIAKDKFEQFSKIRIQGKILQYKIHNNNYFLDAQNIAIFYNIDYQIPQLYSTASMVIANTQSLKETFKSKTKIIQIYLICCGRLLHRFMQDWNCICKILRIITSPFDSTKVFYHCLVYIHESDTDFLYDYLPKHGFDTDPCHCHHEVSFVLYAIFLYVNYLVSFRSKMTAMTERVTTLEIVATVTRMVMIYIHTKFVVLMPPTHSQVLAGKLYLIKFPM